MLPPSYSSVERSETLVKDQKANGSNRNFYLAMIVSLALLSLVGFFAYADNNPIVERTENALLVQANNNEAETHLKANANRCQTYAGGRITKNKKVFDTRVDGALQVEVSFKIDSNSGFGNIIQVGGHGDDEWPAIFFHNSGTDYVTVQFEKEGNSRYYAKNLSPIAFNTEYRVKVQIDGLKCKIYLNDVLKHDFTIPSEFKPSSQSYPVYASGDWNNAASGEITGLSVCAVPSWCHTYGGGRIVKNKKVFDTRVDGKLEVGFTFRIDSNSGFGNIVQIGGHGDDEWPAIFFHNSGTDYVTVQFERQGNSRYYAKNLSPIAFNTDYRLRVEIDGLQCKIYLNGALKHDFTIPSEFKPVTQSYPVYASGDWNNPASGFISGLSVCALPSNCQTYGGGRITKNKKVFDTRVDGKLEVGLAFKIDSNSAFGNIIQIGGHGDDEWPAIFFHNSGTDYVTVQFERQGNSRYYAKNLSPIAFNTEYRLKVVIDGLQCKIYLNGALKHDFTIPSEFKPVTQSYPVYASGDWNNAASGDITGLVVCSGNGGGSGPSLLSLPAVTPGFTSCQQKLALTNIAKGNKLFQVYIGDNYDVDFMVKMDSSSGNGPILWVGDSETDEQPELYYYNDGDLDVEWDTGRFTQYHYSNADINRGTEYLVRVKVRGLSYELIVNGASKGVKTMGSTNKGTPKVRGVYSYPHWKTYSSLRGTLRNVRICGPPPPVSPPSPPSGTSCKFYSGPTSIAKSKQLFRFTTTTNYDLSFKVKMDTSSSNGPIIWVGDNERDEQPEVYWFTDGDVDVEFEASSWGQYHYSNADIFKGNEYSVKVQVRGLSYELFVNSASKGKKYMTSSRKGASRERGVWAYPSWKNFPSLKGTLRDVKMCTV